LARVDSAVDAISWNDIAAAAAAVTDAELATRQAETEFDEPINIQYTSGTTGFRDLRCCSDASVAVRVRRGRAGGTAGRLRV